MLLGILVPTVLLCIGTKILKVNDCVDGNVQLDFTKTQAQEFRPGDKSCHASLFSS